MARSSKRCAAVPIQEVNRVNVPRLAAIRRRADAIVTGRKNNSALPLTSYPRSGTICENGKQRQPADPIPVDAEHGQRGREATLSRKGSHGRQEMAGVRSTGGVSGDAVPVVWGPTVAKGT